jgi:hypothetical protein
MLSKISISVSISGNDKSMVNISSILSTRKIEQREPHWKPWVNSSVPEGLTFPAPPVVPEYITFTVRRMCILQTQRNYRTFLQLIFIILTNSSFEVVSMLPIDRLYSCVIQSSY